MYDRALSADQILADRDTPIAQGSGSQMSALEKLKALLLKLVARWKDHWVTGPGTARAATSTAAARP